MDDEDRELIQYALLMLANHARGRMEKIAQGLAVDHRGNPLPVGAVEDVELVVARADKLRAQLRYSLT